MKKHILKKLTVIILTLTMISGFIPIKYIYADDEAVSSSSISDAEKQEMTVPVAEKQDEQEKTTTEEDVKEPEAESKQQKETEEETEKREYNNKADINKQAEEKNEPKEFDRTFNFEFVDSDGKKATLEIKGALPSDVTVNAKQKAEIVIDGIENLYGYDILIQQNEQDYTKEKGFRITATGKKITDAISENQGISIWEIKQNKQTEIKGFKKENNSIVFSVSESATYIIGVKNTNNAQEAVDKKETQKKEEKKERKTQTEIETVVESIWEDDNTSPCITYHYLTLESENLYNGRPTYTGRDYLFVNEKGETVSSQSVHDKETLNDIPAPKCDGNQTFIGWQKVKVVRRINKTVQYVAESSQELIETNREIDVSKNEDVYLAPLFKTQKVEIINKIAKADNIEVVGFMPKEAVIETTPADIKLTGEKVFESASIKIYASEDEKTNGIEWNTSDETLKVRIKNETFESESFNIFQNTEDGTVEYVDNVQAENSWIEFYTNDLSGLAVTQTISRQITAEDGSSYKVAVTFDKESGITPDAVLQVDELTGFAYEEHIKEAKKFLKENEYTYAKVLNISILNSEGIEIQPKGNVKVNIELLGGDYTEDAFSVIHFGGKTEKLESQTEKGVVSFNTNGFSAYAIVQCPSSDAVGWAKIVSIDEFESLVLSGLCIGHTSGYFFTNGITKISNSRTGITKTKPAQEFPPGNAAPYYFEPVAGSENTFYIYCYNGETKQYVRNTGNNSLSFTTEENKTAFTVTYNASKGFRINNGAWYWNMQGGANGASFASYNSATDANNYMYFWHYISADGDPYNLDEKAYGLMYWNGGITGKALMASSTNANTLDALPLTVMSKKNNNEDKLFVPNDSDMSMWKFQWIDANRYYLTTIVDGSLRYLRIGGTGVSVVSEPDDQCKISVTSGSGAHAGELCLKSGNITLTYGGTVNAGFNTSGTAGSEWLHLVSEKELTPDYLMPYSAKKVSVSDSNVTNGSRIILYTRTWNPNTKKYEIYAVDHDGSLVQCYESGESIQWVGNRINTLLWNFVEYYQEGTAIPTYYYELYNQYSEKYIAPNCSGNQILSDSAVGINLNGRRNGYYYSNILTWDAEKYAYAGLKVQDNRIIPCSISEADNFYFAIMDESASDDTLTEVSTIDHTKHGIKMRVIDFATREEMSDFLGNDAGGAVFYTQPNLLSTYLGEDGYPTAAGGSLAKMFAGAREVNHIFVASSYEESGYYEFDSTQNFASLQPDNNFKVYKEIGSYDGGDKNTLKHGQFFPFNTIEPGVFASVNSKNMYDARGNALSDTDPRKYEQLYLIKNVNTQFGIEIEAQFTQTADGLDAWGHDIIYEFTGDDDFWLYVDGELVIDLGGIHSALPGSINYSTGEVNVNGTDTTLYDIFKTHYETSHPTATADEVNAYLEDKFEQNDKGQWIFHEYTTHTMKIFFFERGGGASNLNMHFNLASVTQGTVELSKELAGVEDQNAFLAEFPYQVFYKLPGEEEENKEHSLTQNDNEIIRVYYKDTIRPVTFKPTLSVDGITYQNVFLLKPGEVAEIHVPDDAIAYKIIECGVDTNIYSTVTVNGESIAGSPVTGNQGRSDFGIDYEETRRRAHVRYVNQLDPTSLRTITITKKLYNESGERELLDDETTFDLRLYLGTEFEDMLPLVNMRTYFVKDRNGNYCRYDSQSGFVSMGTSNYDELTPSQKQTGSFQTSMNGAISKIPAFYTIELREILIGTKFKVEERENEIPDGYSLNNYILKDDRVNPESEIRSETPITGLTVVNKDPQVDVCNLRGWGIRANKNWADADYTEEHGDAYFAIYTGTSENSLTLLNGSVRKLDNREGSVYWYFQNLPVAVPFEQYEVREVSLINPVVDADGIVTSYDAITKISGGESIRISSHQKGETVSNINPYTVLYKKGEISADTNVRVDTVTNYRAGVIVRQEDWQGNPLSNTTYMFTDYNNNIIGTFTSNTDGIVTTAFLSEGRNYILDEIETPQGYIGIEHPVTIQSRNGIISVSGIDSEYYTLTQGENTAPILTIKNRPRELLAIKKDGERNVVLSNVRFALHKQIKIGNVVSIDFNPMPGYENLVTNSDGVISKIDNTLPAGTYELRETTPLEGYRELPFRVLFRIEKNGTVTLITNESDVILEKTVENTAKGTVSFLMSINNYRENVAPTGYTDNMTTYAVLLVCAIGLIVLMLFNKRPTARSR